MGIEHIPNDDAYSKSQQDALLLNIILVKNSTCFGQIYCSIIWSLNTVFVILVMLTACWRRQLTSLVWQMPIAVNTVLRLPIMDSKSVRNKQSSLPKWSWGMVHLVGFYYKNISRCTVLWMSNSQMTPLWCFPASPGECHTFEVPTSSF